MKRTQKHTIYDLAQKTGTSPSTVSAALNGTWRKRRIKQETAERIIEIAQETGYSVNLQARGLRTTKSGLVGFIIPEHNNRFFSDLSQSFTLEARKRGQCPIIIATQRNPEEEIKTVQDLNAYSIDALFIVGAADPTRISLLCRDISLPHVFIDQPCPGALSVITDNESGAIHLTDKIIETIQSRSTSEENKIYFIGGNSNLYASSRRITGFKSSVSKHFGFCDDSQIISCGYDSEAATSHIKDLYDKLGGLPSGLFINSVNVFEGLLQFFIQLPESELNETSIGCFDYEPYGSLLRFPVHMIRQRYKKLVEDAYSLIEGQSKSDILITVEPELYAAHRHEKGSKY